VADAIEVVRSLRTIHGDFSDRHVSEVDLRRILDLSVRSANASNRQSYSIIVVRDADRMQELLGYHASVALFFLADLNRSVDVAAYLGHEFAVRGMPMLMSSIVDACLAAQTATIAAKALGIDSLFTNAIHRMPMQRLRDELMIPEKYCFPIVALLLGFPAAEPDRQRGRLSGAGVIHDERYQRLTSEEAAELVRVHDDPSAGLDMGFAWQEKGFAHFLDWFYSVWSRRFPAEEGPSQVVQWLEESGFLARADCPPRGARATASPPATD
jgi:FMN reductase [NAD(P)H]